MLADRPLLLLDEPTEGVDADTEAAIVAALPAITAGRTALIVSHRPAVLAACDRVVDLLPQAASASDSAADPTPSVPPRPSTAPVDAPDTQAPRAACHRPPACGGPWRATRGQRARLALAAALGAAALGCGVALTATSAWLISAAALQPPVLTLMVAIVAVRAFGLGKGVLRYAERLVSHDAALRCGSALRVQIWAQLVRLGPAATARIRRGELLSRLVADVDAQQDLLIRVLVPAAAAAAVGLLTAVGVGLLLPAAGLVIAAGLLVAGILAPAATAWAAHRTERRTAAARGDVLARTVEIIDGAPDLLVCGAAAAYRQRLDTADTRLGALLRRAALARGLGSGLAVLAIGATAVAGTAVGIAALRDGTLPGPALAVLALTPLALADVVAGLPDAAVRLLTAVPAAHRLAELATTQAPVTEPASSPTRHRPHRVRRAGPRGPLARRRPRRRARRRPGPHPRRPAGAGRALRRGEVHGGRRAAAHAGPARGHLRADGRDVRTLPSDDVRAGIAWCGARAHLFDSTLRANLLLAAPDATDDDLVARPAPGPARRLARRAAPRPGHPDRRTRRHRLRRRAPAPRHRQRPARPPPGVGARRAHRAPRRRHGRRSRRRADGRHRGPHRADRHAPPRTDPRAAPAPGGTAGGAGHVGSLNPGARPETGRTRPRSSGRVRPVTAVLVSPRQLSSAASGMRR